MLPREVQEISTYRLFFFLFSPVLHEGQEGKRRPGEVLVADGCFMKTQKVVPRNIYLQSLKR